MTSGRGARTRIRKAFPMAETAQADRKTLILTGASRGIGHATVKRFSSAGWRVITCSRHAFPENCPWEMGRDDHIQVDLADPEDTLRAIATMKTRLEAQNGKLYALVNNAGISPKGGDGERLNTITTDIGDWQRVFQVNLFAPMMLGRGLLEELRRYPKPSRFTAPTVIGLLLTAVFAAVTGLLIGKYLL